MQNKQNRILWLFNHETLREFEVPLLRSFGFEVFLPKLYPNTEEWGSGSVDRSYDDSLTIPSWALEILNNHDFYMQPITNEIAKIINSYFSLAIFGAFAFLFEQLLDHFTGKLFMHVFGRELPNHYGLFLNSKIFKRLFAIQDRFFFAQSYPFLKEVESSIYKHRALTLPLGVPEKMLTKSNSWKGGNKKLLFVCPRITSSSYYQNIYSHFKKHFSTFPHLIAGKQFFPMPDPAIQGNLPRDQYDLLLQTSEAMFYHSEEPRHLHYHPMEAIIFGMPLIYMQRGVLGRLVNQQRLPGSCLNIEEARKKIAQILQGDKLFISEVLDSQKQLLKTYDCKYCEQVWKSNFLPIARSEISKEKTKLPKKVRIFIDYYFVQSTTRLHRKFLSLPSKTKIALTVVKNNKKKFLAIFGLFFLFYIVNFCKPFLIGFPVKQELNFQDYKEYQAKFNE